MKIKHTLPGFLIVFLLLTACDLLEHDHHEHAEPEVQHQQRMTRWKDDLELYIKFDTAVAGLSQDWVVYLTQLPGYEPARNISLELQFQMGSEVRWRYQMTESGIQGRFIKEIAIPEAGQYDLSVAITTAQDSQTIAIGTVDIAGSKPFTHQHSDRNEEEILFPKLQQWHMPFATSVAQEDFIAPQLLVSTRVESIPEKYVRLLTPATGLVGIPEGGQWPSVGMEVSVGQPLAQVLPVSGGEDMGQLQLEIVEANERYRLARSELERVRSLNEQGIVADRRIEQAEAEANVARQTLRRLESQRDLWSGSPAANNTALVLRAPINGLIVSIESAPGEIAGTGDRLFTILDDSRVRLNAQIFPADLESIDVLTEPLLRQADGQWVRLEPMTSGMLLRTINANDGSASFLMEVDNSKQNLITGSRLSIAFRTAEAQRHVVVPASALLNDDGVSIVIVQVDGESFQRRIVRPGVRALGQVAILEGLAAGERIVTLGAYTVLLAARETSTDVGHTH
ncbi:efflux RND transporter periplasmic adaptor subunit [Methylophaga lonarensis]|uniref:efflux RND transporter periplasmic adaptor subunit n=1 Tax=Methylophaga lonarensis TaxID=999151 RepID=UPI003D2B77CC